MSYWDQSMAKIRSEVPGPKLIQIQNLDKRYLICQKTLLQGMLLFATNENLNASFLESGDQNLL